MNAKIKDDPFTFPLKISANRRHLVDQNDRPFLVHGDTAWSLISALSEAEVEHYLSDRATRGFNAIIVNLIEHKFNGPFTRHGQHPFTQPEDLSKPNEKYFEYADWVLERAAELGFVVFLAPLYLGYKHPADDDGWYHEAHIGGRNRCYRYGRFIGKRYSGFKNIIWMMGGDRNPDGVVDEVQSIIVGIKESDPHSLFTAHPHPEYQTLDTYGWGGWLDFNFTYTYQIVHKRLLADYNRRPAMPFVLIESTYEGEHNASAVQIRRQAYWAVLCGAMGQFMGNRPIWLFDPGWEQAIDSQGSRDMPHVKAFFTSRDWHKFIPDQSHTIITQGLGEFNGMDYLAAACTSDGKTIMAYLPSARTIIVDLAKLNASKAVAWWFDPRTGASHLAGEFSTLKPVQLTPPEDSDWGLIVEDAALGLEPPAQQN